MQHGLELWKQCQLFDIFLLPMLPENLQLESNTGLIPYSWEREVLDETEQKSSHINDS